MNISNRPLTDVLIISIAGELVMTHEDVEDKAKREGGYHDKSS